MLGPHHRENAQLDQIGRAAHPVNNDGIFLFVEAMFGNNLRRNLGWCVWHSLALSWGGRVSLALRRLTSVSIPANALIYGRTGQ